MAPRNVNLTFSTKQAAQDRADRMHADLIASNPLYAESAALYDAKNPEKGGTARWCFPYQILDDAGKPTDALWRVVVDERPIPVLSVAERTAIGIAVEVLPIQEEIIK